MSNDRKPLAPPRRPPPTVTYSRVPAGTSRRPRPANSRDAERVEPHLTATEVPFDDLNEWRDEVAQAPDLRAVRDEARGPAPDVGAELFPPPRKRRSRVGFFLLVGFVAIVAGVGVLAASFMTVTDSDIGAPAVSNEVAAEILSLKKTIADLEGSAGASTDATRSELAELRERLAELEAGRVAPTADATSSAPAVREISIDQEAAPAAPSTAALPPPPAPRSRPEGAASTASPDATEPAAATPRLAEPGPDPAPAKPRAPVAKTPSKAPQPRSGEDDFLADIERTLNANRAAAESRAAAPPPPPPPPPGAVAANGPDAMALPPDTMIVLPPDAMGPEAVGAPMELPGRGAPDEWSPDGAPIPPEEIPNAYPMD